jgi:hypothetical protein
LKKAFAILVLFISTFPLQSQNLYLKIEGTSPIETKIIDSITYKRQHTDAKSVSDEASLASQALLRRGYLENTILRHQKVNDSTFLYTFAVNEKTNIIHIYIGELSTAEKELLGVSNDTMHIPVNEVEPFMNNALKAMERTGYSLNSLQLTNYSRRGKGLIATLRLKSEKKRVIDGLVIEGYDKFPEGIRKNILKQYKGKTFNQENLQRIYTDFNNLRFVNQKRYPEILFTTDSTKVYVYLEKSKSNSFDGFVGFGNDEGSNIIFTGYVDLLLNNVVNTGEKFNLYWKSDGKEQTTFNAGIELPYIFKTPIGIKANLRIFKQDSTFQNTVTDVNLGYYFSYNSKLYVGRQQTQSVDIQNLNNEFISDYSNTFWTSGYEYNDYTLDDFLFPERTSLLVRGGLGKRDAKTGTYSQYFGHLAVSHNIYLNKKNIINLRNHSYYLNSDNYIVNELFRFGGINSIRGFNENSLQANLTSLFMAEYRYVLAPNIYIHSITDYGYFQDKTADITERILGLGFGLGILTKNGRFNIIYANGSTQNQQIKLSNSIVHISLKTIF